MLVPVFLGVILFIAGRPAAALGGTAIAKNVVIVVIDGLRNDEAFDDPDHKYIPHIWNDLRPLGTINTNFWNTGLSATTPGHIQLLSGVRQLLHLELSGAGEVASKYPTILEYYRKEKNVPKGNVWVISGKGEFTNSINASLHPDYAGWEASKDNLHRTDIFTWEAVKQKMDIYHPSLIIINFGQTDYAGHSNVYSAYLKAVSIADDLVYQLWLKIQGDPFYRDKTDLIVTTDHGRNSTGCGRGFMDHGNDDRGNRHILFLAMGPDFRENYEVTERADQIDIGPTVGAILGVQTPHADGRVMTELFRDPLLGQTLSAGGQRRVKLSAYADGVHMVWSEKNGEEWDIYYKKSTSRGTVWTQPVKLFSSGGDSFFYEADITSQDDGTVFVVATGYSSAVKCGNTFIWNIRGIRSTDSGNIFEKPVLLANVTRAAYPRVVSNGRYIVVAYTNEGMETLVSADGGLTFLSYSADNDAGKGFHYRAVYTDMAVNDSDIYAVWSNDRHNAPIPSFWNVSLNRFKLAKAAWEEPVVITPGVINYSPAIFFADNSVAVNSSGLTRVLSSRRATVETDGQTSLSKWRGFLQTSPDGLNFHGYWVGPSSEDMWNPKIIFPRPLLDDFLIVWERHSMGAGSEIMGRINSGSSWGDPFLISPAASGGAFSAGPALSAYKGNVYAGWQELVNGKWQIKVKKIL